MTVAQLQAPSQRHSLHAKANALSVILADEFGVPFTFFDPAGLQEVVLTEKGCKLREHEMNPLRLAAQEGRCRVHSLDENSFLLILVFFEGKHVILSACAVMQGVSRKGPERQREQERLRKWLQAFSDRLRLNDLLVAQRREGEEQAAQLKRAWEVILALEDAIRHLRIYRDSEKNRRSLLRLSRSLLGAQCLLWLPQKSAVCLHEGDPIVSPSDYPHLVELLSRHGDVNERKPILWNAEAADLWKSRFPQIRNILAMAVNDQENGGLLIALNKFASSATRAGKASDASSPFRRADAAALAPFAALLGLQLRSARRYQELKEFLVGLTRSLTAALDAKDPYTLGHSERVARIAMELAQELGFKDDEISDIYLAGLLHDIGKIGIPDAILSKPGPLDAAETEG